MEVDAASELLSGGMYDPCSKNDLTLDIRSSEEADGDNRMIGSWRREGLPFGNETREAEAPAVAAGPAPSLERPDLRYASADLRTWEKSLFCQFLLQKRLN